MSGSGSSRGESRFSDDGQTESCTQRPLAAADTRGTGISVNVLSY